ncbi:hypothetical protein [Mucilaginibacter polytrichastri]|uniref:Uncharacterized protein n=1 Tax=Mucilaginibacter polytrichastri TaxID=1302689 RepID=A0A1Q6A2G0_9SPHI|nr:hypothetical protein [Mucilaginibacter polytrichastri]OKS88199.1 hypothetical protein RG47T_3663 [Mucilaginibacter polytrichastri]SFT08476.1 hypothetical protein SAMN04487890_11034 [Mucilaginibacter polytrichastri]
MKHFLFSCFLLITIISSFSYAQTKSKKATSASAEVLTNASLISLHKAGLDDEVIISKIETSPTNFDVSTDRLIDLKNAGVSNAIIKALIDKGSGKSAKGSTIPNIKRDIVTAAAPDVDMINNPYYLDKAAGKATGLESTTAKAKIKINPLKAFIPTSSFPVMLRVDGEKSPVQLQANSTFIVNCGNTMTPEVVFGLYRYSTIKKGYRETIWQKVSGINTGQDKDMVSFNYKKLKDGVYEIIPNAPLDKGEYCFVNRMSYTNYKEMKADVFAFGVE